MPVRVCAYAARPFPGVSSSGATNAVSNKDARVNSLVSHKAAGPFGKHERFPRLRVQTVKANIGWAGTSLAV